MKCCNIKPDHSTSKPHCVETLNQFFDAREHIMKRNVAQSKPVSQHRDSHQELLWKRHHCLQIGCALFILTSVPYLDNAAFACWRIFSLYIWAARLLYLALVSFVTQPCWRKNDVFRWVGRRVISSEHKERNTNKTIVPRIRVVNTDGHKSFYYSINLMPDFWFCYLTALPLPPTCIHLSWNQFQLESNSVDLRRKYKCKVSTFQ